jgi:predicted amidophosphoribosyltransferase
MLCQACHRFESGNFICALCRSQLRPASDRILPGGVRLVAAFQHTGPAVTLVHHFKYRGLVDYADLVASMLAERLPALPLVPIPRALTRRLRYGVDPARSIAERLATRLDVPVFPLLVGPVHRRRRAGGDHTRPVNGFRLRGVPKCPVILVDDVVTTGSTLLSGISSIGESYVHAAAAANAARGVSSLLVATSQSPISRVTRQV